MRRWKIPISEIVLCCLPLLLFSGCFYLMLNQAVEDEYKVSTKHSSVVFDFTHLWDMKFPEGFSSVYVFYNRGGWMGEGDFFAAYECEQPNDEFLKDFSADLNDEVKERINSYFNYFPYNSEKYEIILDKAYQPDWEQDFISVSYHKGTKDILYIGKDNCGEYCDDHLYMSYFPDTKMLYIFESIT